MNLHTEITQAAERIGPYIRETPLIRSAAWVTSV
jgi:hypothetical protein